MLDIMVYAKNSIIERTYNEIIACNDDLIENGLVISPQDAQEIVQAESCALAETMRFSFSSSAALKIIKAFSDSPYIYQSNFNEIICRLIDVFYYYKDETMDKLSDDDLIRIMKTSFNGESEGAVEILTSKRLETVAKNIRFGYPPEYVPYENDEETDEDENSNSGEATCSDDYNFDGESFDSRRPYRKN